MKNIRIGIFGANRGSAFIESILTQNAEIVAVCERKQKYIDMAKEKLGNYNATFYTDFDEFINHPMDAVLLANCFHEHTPYAIKCLEKNIHVLCECTSNSTMAEGVALVRAAKKSKAFYMLSENYPFMLFNREMQRVCKGGTLGKILYAEGEYNHPADPSAESFIRTIYDSDKHWRCYLPATYYITHSLAPLMVATNARPKRVNATAIFSPPAPDSNNPGRSGDKAAIITTLNDDDSVFRVTGCAAFGCEGNNYRFAGENGQIENIRGDVDRIALNYNGWQVPEGMEEHNFYKCEESDHDKDLIEKAGHGGGDFLVMREFLNCVRNNRKPYMDEYFATTLASVAILGHRSILNGGIPFDIPDFRNESDRVKFENDNQTPFYYSDGREPNIPCSSHSGYKPSDKQIENFY